MTRNLSIARILACAGMVLFLAACNVPTAAPATMTPPAAASPTVAAATATSAPSATAVPATTTATATAATAASAPLITAENAGSLTTTPLTLDKYPSDLLWPGQSAALPTGFTPRPALIVRAENNTLYPIQLDPPAVGQAVTLPLSSAPYFFSRDLSFALALSQNAPVTLTDLTGKPLATLNAPSPYGASFSPDGKLVAVTSSSELAATLFDTASGQPVTKLTGFQTAAPVYAVNIIPGDQYVYWIARAGLQLQSIQTGAMGKELRYTDFIGPVTFTPDGQRMALYVAGSLYLYAVPDLTELAHLTLSEGANSLSVSPDGRLLAAGYGASITVFDLGENHAKLLPVANLAGPNEFSGSVAFSPDGRYLVSVHDNNIIAIWKAK